MIPITVTSNKCHQSITSWNWPRDLFQCWNFSLLFWFYNICPKEYESLHTLTKLWNLIFFSVQKVALSIMVISFWCRVNPFHFSRFSKCYTDSRMLILNVIYFHIGYPIFLREVLSPQKRRTYLKHKVKEEVIGKFSIFCSRLERKFS